MNKLIVFLILSSLVSCEDAKKENQLGKENQILKEKPAIAAHPLTALIPNGYQIVEFNHKPFIIKSDLNKDGIPDYVVILANRNPTEEYSNAEIVKVSIFEGQDDSTYQLASQTGNLSASFLHTISDDILKVVDTNTIRLKHQSMRHDYELKFRYESKYKNYMLIGSEYNNYGNAIQEGAGNSSSNFLTGKRISTINGKRRTNMDKELKPISAIDDSTIYALIHQ